MSKDEFETQLQKLITRARGGGEIPLFELIDTIAAEITGLEMAHNEGEEV